MNEVTYVAEGDEVYVNEDEGGTPGDVYTSPDSPLVRETRHLMSWVDGKNPLFLHASDPQAAVDYMEKHRWIRTDD